MPYDYLRDPAAIYRRSFELIRRECDLSRFPPELHPLALRLVHAVADPSILADLVWSDGAVAAGHAALRRVVPPARADRGGGAVPGARARVSRRLRRRRGGEGSARGEPARHRLCRPRRTARRQPAGRRRRQRAVGRRAARMTPWLAIIGIGDDGVEGLSAAARVLLASAELVVGGTRHLALVPEGNEIRQ